MDDIATNGSTSPAQRGSGAHLCCNDTIADGLTYREKDPESSPSPAENSNINEHRQVVTVSTDADALDVVNTPQPPPVSGNEIISLPKTSSMSNNKDSPLDVPKDEENRLDASHTLSSSTPNELSKSKPDNCNLDDSDAKHAPLRDTAGPPSCTARQPSGVVKRSRVTDLNLSNRATTHESTTSDMTILPRPESDSKAATSTGHMSLSIGSKTPTAMQKKRQASGAPQSGMTRSSQEKSSNANSQKRHQRANKRIIPSSVNTTINILSSSIPRTAANRVVDEEKEDTLADASLASEGTNEGGHTSKAPVLDSVDPELEVDGNGTTSLDLNDLADLDDLSQYGQDNVKCIGAAATCETYPNINRPNTIKNTPSSLLVFTSTPTKDIVKLPCNPPQPAFEQVVLPPSEKQPVTLSGSDMLILAAKNSDNAAIEMYKGSTGSHDSSGMFALAYCVLENNASGVKALLAESKMRTLKSMKFNDIDYVDIDALTLSIVSDANKEIIEALVPKSDASTEGYSSMTALMLAAGRGNVAAVELLVDSQKNMKTKDGRTALMAAAEFGHDRCVEILLERTSEVCLQNTMGWTALCFAADNGHVACVRLLAPKESMMLIIFAYDRYSASGIIMNFMSGTSLMLAAWHGSAECVSILKDSEAKIKTHKYENTALIFAATAGHSGCVKLLMDVEAKMQDSSGRTALMKAATEDNVSCVELLAPVEGGMVDERGTPAIVFAARKNHLDCVALLAPYEANAFHHLILNRNWCSQEVSCIIKKNLHKKGC